MRSLLLSMLCLLLVGSAAVVRPQKASKRTKVAASAGPAMRNPAGESPAGIAFSPAQKLAITGANVGLLGILQIKTAPTLEGPLLISVVNPDGPVVQSNGDPSGALLLPLTRKQKYSVQLALGRGENVITVMDTVEGTEKAMLKWTGVETSRPADDRVAQPPVLARAEAPGVAAPRVANTSDPTVRSASRKLSVLAIHDDKQATFNVGVGDLRGPFTITVTDEANKVVETRKKELGRSETSFVETIPLKGGQYAFTVASSDTNEAAESVTLGPWKFEGPAANEAKPATESGVGKSEKGNLSASVSRVKGKNAELKVNISNSLTGFKVRVVDSKGKEIENRSFPNLERNVNDWSLRIKAGEGDNKVTVSSLDEKESVELDLDDTAAKPTQTPAATTDEEDPPEYDWGRVRGYFAAGMVFSKERDDFSQSDMFLDFTLDKNYSRDGFGPFKNVNTFFNARLTSIPVAATEAAETGDGDGNGNGNGGGEGEEAEPCTTPDCEEFITSRKAAMMQAGIYLPMYGKFMMWKRRVVRPDDSYRDETNALFVAPLAKGGIMTITGDRETAEGAQFGGDDIFNFYSFGVMLGHYRVPKSKNIAPELISWLTISTGRWENFEHTIPTGEKNALGEDITVRRRPWRFEALGRLKIPETPFIIGFDGNFGKGPDDLRFLFGTRFDIGKVMRTLKLAAAKDSLGRNEAPKQDGTVNDDDDDDADDDDDDDKDKDSKSKDRKTKRPD